MWADIETSRDSLNFRVLASLISQMILDAKGRPLSIGISGGWGVGKSSMVKLVEADLAERMQSADDAAKPMPALLFVNFNAWLYQGQDDAKAALMEEIAQALMQRAKSKETGVSKTVGLLRRINVFRGLKLVGELALSVYTGLPIGALARAGKNLYDNFADGEVSTDDLEGAASVVEGQMAEAKHLVRSQEAETPPQMIQAIRRQFEELLEELDVTLVVFVDDLDRCLPPTIIGTLEAMRLFLFMNRTAFVIAADDRMIKEAVKIHFPGAKIDDDIVISYFDKLIQVPLRVPPLGTNEVKAYLMMLFVENSGLPEAQVEEVRRAVNRQLAISWQGKAVDAEFVQSLIQQCPDTLKAELELADRLARQMIASPKVNGNPRLIKRFLNTLSIRRSLAKVQNIAVDDSIFAKLLLFERFVSPTSFNSLTELISMASDGRSEILRDLEADARSGKEITDNRWPTGWKEDSKLVLDWLKLAPSLGGVDLRGALHVGRESAPIILAENKLSQNATTMLTQLLTLKVSATSPMKTALTEIAPDERAVIMTNLLDKASGENDWGVPHILFALEAMADADTIQASRLVTLLSGLAPVSLKPSLLPRLQNKEWGKLVLANLAKRTDLTPPAAKAVGEAKKGKS